MVGARIDQYQLEPLLSRFSWTNGPRSDALCNYVISSRADFGMDFGPQGRKMTWVNCHTWRTKPGSLDCLQLCVFRT
jgi:hypothetical protein